MYLCLFPEPFSLSGQWCVPLLVKWKPLPVVWLNRACDNHMCSAEWSVSIRSQRVAELSTTSNNSHAVDYREATNYPSHEEKI